MVKSFLLSPSVNLVEEVMQRLSADGADYSNNLVVFPGKRPGYFLRKAIATKEGKSFIPPTEFSIEEFVDLIFRQILGRHEPTLDELDAVSLLFEQHLNSLERLGGEHFTSLEAFLPLGIKLFEEMEELRIAGCSPKLVREKVGGITYGNLYLLPGLYERFYKEVEDRHYITRASKFMIVSQKLDPKSLSKYSNIVLAGFFALTHAEREIFRKLISLRQTTILLQQSSYAERIVAELGLDPERVGDSHDPSITIHRSPDVHGQVFALTAQIQEMIDRKLPLDEETVIVLPSPDALFPILHQTLSLLNPDQYNISLAYGLVRSPVYAFLNAIFELIGSRYRDAYHAPSYIKFALHPYTKNILFRQRADVTRVLFHAIEDEFAERGAATFFELEKLEEQHHIFERVERTLAGDEHPCTAREIQEHLKYIHDRTIRPLQHIRDIGEFSARCIEVLSFIYDESTARLHPYFHPFAEKTIEALDRLSKGLLKSQSFAEPRAYVTFIREYLARAEVHFAGTPLRGIQTLGLLETRNLKFSRAFILDMNDEVVPGRLNQTTNLLPQKLREDLGLETTYDRERLQEAYVQTLIEGAKEVSLFFTDNGKREKSRLIEKLLWERQKKERQPDPATFVKSISYRVSLKNDIPQPIPKTPAMIQYLKGISYSATSLDAYLQCPIKFYYSHVAGLKEKEEVAEDIEARDIGELIHDVLHDWFEEALEQPLTKELLKRQDLSKAIEKNMQKSFGEYEYGTLTLIKMQIAKQLSRFLENYQEPLLDKVPIRITELEAKVEVEKNDFLFRVRMDRIERREDNVYILDYKTGGDPSRLKTKIAKLDLENRQTWANAIGSFQLPLYAMVYQMNTGVGIEKIKPAFLFLGRNKIDETIESPLFDEEIPVGHQMSKLEEVLFKVLKEIVDPDTPFHATKELEENCPQCPFQRICGTEWVLGWRQS
jgi:CRISPR/Cas system-associated exonuclease Cas4 (RecB family)